jgi:hypothetical protein
MALLTFALAHIEQRHARRLPGVPLKESLLPALSSEQIEEGEELVLLRGGT